MPNYKKMYYILFNKITDVIIELEEVQKKVEEMYISEETCILRILDTTTKEETDN